MQIKNLPLIFQHKLQGGDIKSSSAIQTSLSASITLVGQGIGNLVQIETQV